MQVINTNLYFVQPWAGTV